MDPAVIAIAGSFVAALGAYFVAARRFSGKIDSSEASELWKESRSIRDWSKERIGELSTDVDRLQKRVEALEVGNEALAVENNKLSQQVHKLGETITELREEIRVLTKELKASHERVEELEEEAES